ncbi:MAG: beta-1,6-N-acetylglucosaminyltransferase [Arthrobacter sp.]
MRTIFLIAAHYDAEQFAELVRSLDGRPVFAHIDQKTDISDFRAATQSMNVEFVPDADRVDVKWGGWSQVASTLAMLRLAGPSISPQDYVILLSGDSYPLQPPESIDYFLSKSPGAQYINSVRMPNDVVSKPLSRVTRFYMEFDPRNGKRNLVPKIINRLGVPRQYTKAFAGRVPYAGSTWWALTGAACMWMLDVISSEPKLVKFCRGTKMPDEFFFQTLIANSQFKAHIRRSPMFTDWSRPSGPKPAVLDHDHILELASENLKMCQPGYGEGVALFGRKVTDPLIAARIREQLWSLNLD